MPDPDYPSTKPTPQMKGLEITLMALVSLFLVFAISYGLAKAGEPQALWLWRDVIGGLVG
jgi:hypothetical protein